MLALSHFTECRDLVFALVVSSPHIRFALADGHVRPHPNPLDVTFSLRSTLGAIDPLPTSGGAGTQRARHPQPPRALPPGARHRFQPYTLNREPNKPCTLHPTPYTLHPSPYTLHSKP